MNHTCICNDTLCVKAFDFVTDSTTDSDAIDNALNFAKEHHIPMILIDTKDWILNRAIEIPNNKTVVADGIKLKLADGVLDNVFRPEGMIINPQSPNGFPITINESMNIRIIGKNGAMIEGPDVLSQMYHPYFHEYQLTEGDYWGWRGFLVFFSRCTGFELCGFRIQKPRSWAISAERSQNGYIHDLDIFSTCKNGDGINLRMGCSRIFIENIRAKTSDDCIALNTYEVSETNTYPCNEYVYPLHPSNYLIDQGEPIEDRYIHDIYIKNIISSTDHFSQAITLLTRHGHKIYHIRINEITDGNPIIYPPKRIDMIGAYYSSDSGYGDCSIGDLADIQIDNVISNSAGDALLFRDSVDNLCIMNVVQNCPNRPALTFLNQPYIAHNIKSISGEPMAAAKSWFFDVSNYTVY